MTHPILKRIPEKKREDLDKLLHLLSAVKAVQGVALGGSYARGTAHSGSDIDIGVYYSETDPLDIEEIQKIVEQMNPLSKASGLYEWGAFVNGGSWIEAKSGKIDLLYRNLEHVQRVIEESIEGDFSCDVLQQPPFGFYSVTYLGETQSCIPILDKKGWIESLKKKVRVYPDALRRAMIQQNLWSVEFTLMHAKKCAKGNDLYSTAGCITRMLSCLTQSLFALNKTYFISDREAMNLIEGFEISPKRYKEKVEEVMSHLNGNLEKSVSDMEAIFIEVKKLAGTLYQAKY